MPGPDPVAKPAGPPSRKPLLQVTRLQKSYNVPVLTDFHFELLPGEVHALVGSNGAGKSTFARLLCGLTEADQGEMRLNGALYRPRTRHDAEQAGVVMVLQELNLVRTLSVAENLFLDHLPRSAGFVRFGELAVRAREALSRVGLENVEPTAPAGSLGVGQQQLVEIAGALARNCRLLILDEPTAALTDPEIERLFCHLHQMRARGIGIIYISHRMSEISRIADRITVLRDGRAVATHPCAELTAHQLVREMVGHDLPERPAREGRPGEVALQVRGLKAGDRVRGVSFEVRRGEILGLAGLIGSGRTETLRAIFGADPLMAGEVFVGGQALPAVIRRPTDAVRIGMGMVSEDRKQDGLLLPLPVGLNLTLASLPKHARRFGWLDAKAEASTAESLGRRVDLRCASLEQPVAELSGGNQQKVVIARWLARECDVFLLDEPTRGVDVAAKDTIYRLLRALAAEGKALLVVSSELTELMAISDRIAVMSAGQIVAEFGPAEWSQEKLLQAAFSGYLDVRS